MNVLVLGETTYCLTCLMDNFPLENKKYDILEKYESGGGSAANIAYLLGTWGIETYFASLVGNDDYANIIKKEFKNANVKTDYLETNFEKNTPMEFIIINKQNGSRTDFTLASNLGHLKKEDWNVNPDFIISDGLEYHASSVAFSKYPNAQSVLLADVVTPEKLDLCKFAKYIIFSKEFAEKITNYNIDYNNSNTLVSLYNNLISKYPKATIIVTLEDKGALYSVNGNIRIMPGLKTDVKDSSGAGDVFIGAFVYGLSCKYDLEKVITLANIAGGLSTEMIGSRASIPDLNSVLTYYAQKYNTNQVMTSAQNPQNTNTVMNQNAPVIPNTSVNPSTTNIPNQEVNKISNAAANNNK